MYCYSRFRGNQKILCRAMGDFKKMRRRLNDDDPTLINTSIKHIRIHQVVMRE